MKVVALTLAVALLGLGAACSDAAGEESAELDETCHGQPSPVDEEEIVRVLGRYGFELFREDYCWGLAGANAPAAMYTNMPASMAEATADVVWASASGWR